MHWILMMLYAIPPFRIPTFTDKKSKSLFNDEILGIRQRVVGRFISGQMICPAQGSPFNLPKYKVTLLYSKFVYQQ